MAWISHFDNSRGFGLPRFAISYIVELLRACFQHWSTVHDSTDLGQLINYAIALRSPWLVGNVTSSEEAVLSSLCTTTFQIWNLALDTEHLEFKVTVQRRQSYVIIRWDHRSTFLCAQTPDLTLCTSLDIAIREVHTVLRLLQLQCVYEFWKKKMEPQPSKTSFACLNSSREFEAEEEDYPW